MSTATVGSILDEFCDIINQPRETAYVTASTPAARQYVALFKSLGRDLVSNPNGWSQLKRIYTFTITTGISQYQLPGDFERPLTGTQWGVTTQVPLIGPITDAQLAYQTYGIAPISPFSSYQVNSAQGYIFNTAPYTQQSQGYFEISPTGQNSTDVNVIAYRSSNFVWPINWIASTVYVAGNIRTGVNNMYYCTVGGTSGTTRLSATTGSTTDNTCTWVPYHEPYAIASDSDFCLFDTNVMIEGMRYKWYQSKKQEYQDIYQNYLNLVANAQGRQNGSIRVNAGVNENNVYEFPPVPIGSWGNGI